MINTILNFFLNLLWDATCVDTCFCDSVRLYANLDRDVLYILYLSRSESDSDCVDRRLTLFSKTDIYLAQQITIAI